MVARNPVYLVAGLPFLTILVLVVFETASRPYDATPDTQSAFFQNYTQKHVDHLIAPFMAQFESESSTGEASAGRRFVTNRLTVKPEFAIQPERSSALLNALREDLSAQLRRDGAKILSITGDPHTELHLTYRIGQILGEATLSGSFADSFGSNNESGAIIGPPAGTQYMAANIAISERWFPREASAIRASPQTH